MDKKNKSGIMPREKIEELNDEQLSEVNGGLTISTSSGNVKPDGLKLGQALKNNSSFTKSDDRLP